MRKVFIYFIVLSCLSVVPLSQASEFLELRKDINNVRLAILHENNCEQLRILTLKHRQLMLLDLDESFQRAKKGINYKKTLLHQIADQKYKQLCISEDQPGS